LNSIDYIIDRESALIILLRWGVGGTMRDTRNDVGIEAEACAHRLDTIRYDTIYITVTLLTGINQLVLHNPIKQRIKKIKKTE